MESLLKKHNNYKAALFVSIFLPLFIFTIFYNVINHINIDKDVSEAINAIFSSALLLGIMPTLIIISGIKLGKSNKEIKKEKQRIKEENEKAAAEYERIEAENRKIKHEEMLEKSNLDNHRYNEKNLISQRNKYTKELHVLPRSFVVLKTETTGLDPIKDEIILIAALRIKNGQLDDQFYAFIKSPVPISIEASHKNHITNEMLQDAQDYETVIEEFREFVGDLPIVGHYAITFDIKFIKTLTFFKNECYDTSVVAKELIKYIDGYSLKILCKYFNIKFDEMNYGLGKCYAILELAKKLNELYNKNVEIELYGKA